MRALELAALEAGAPMLAVPTIVDGTIGTTPANLGTDMTATGWRRVRLVNTHATATLSLLHRANGVAFVGTEGVGNGAKVGPGGVLTEIVHSSIGLGVVADAAGCTYNATISDVVKG